MRKRLDYCHPERNAVESKDLALSVCKTEMRFFGALRLLRMTARGKLRFSVILSEALQRVVEPAGLGISLCLCANRNEILRLPLAERLLFFRHLEWHGKCTLRMTARGIMVL